MKAGLYEANFAGEKIPFYYIKDAEEASHVLNLLLEKGETYAIDTETAALPKYRATHKAALSPHLSRVRLIQVFTGRAAFVFDTFACGSDGIFTKFLEEGKFVGHNSVFDLQYFVNQFKASRCSIGCTYLTAKLLFHATAPTDEGLGASLKNLSDIILGKDILKEMQLSDFSVPELTFEQVEYSALDAICTYKVAEKLAPKLKKYGLERIYKLYKDAQMPIVRMQLNGFGFDVDRHRDIIADWRGKLWTAKKALLQSTGLERITGPQIGEYLQKTLPADILDIWPRTEKGAFQVDSHAFADFGFIDAIKPFAEYKKYETLCAGFGSKLIDLVNPETNRLHSHFRLAGARTGRMSCTDPNIQQSPRDKTFRESFVSSGGKSLLVCDYSQIEIRVGAELSQDEVMLNAYRNGIDLHALTASRISGKPIKEVTKDERFAAKAFNFGLMFGLGAKKFSHYAKKSYGVEVSEAEAHRGVKTFRDTYSGYRAWQLQQSNAAAQTMLTTTVCGKRRALDKDNYYGASLNTPVQGSAAECMLHALVELEKRDYAKYLVNCVHDELILELPENLVNDGKEVLESCMIDGFLKVFPEGITRGLVDAHSGANWAVAKG